MIWAVLLLIGAGLTLCYRLRSRPGRYRAFALLGTVLAIVAYLTGFSIGVLFAPVAAVLVLVAASGVRAD